MPYVKRDGQGKVLAVARDRLTDYEEYLDPTDSELVEFSLDTMLPPDTLSASDQGLIRVLEDLVELLTAKGIILFTELPESAQEKIMRRKGLRQSRTPSLDLLGED
jgi:hypothetical protein